MRHLSPYKWLGKIKSSIYAKLIIVLIAAGLLLNMVVASLFQLFSEENLRSLLSGNVDNYFAYIIQDLADPPQREVAEQIAGRYHIHMRYQKEIPGKKRQTIWQTSAFQTPASHRYLSDFWHHDDSNPSKRRWYRGLYFREIQTGNKIFQFSLNARHFSGQFSWALLSLFIVLILFFAMVYLILKRLLRPLMHLSEGVERVRLGDYVYRVPEKGNDQLAMLSRQFNVMSQQIGQNIETKDRMLTAVSHELRSPLARMKVALEFLSEGKGKSQIREDIDVIDAIITVILEQERLRSRYGTLVRVSIDLVALMDDITHELSGLAKREIYTRLSLEQRIFAQYPKTFRKKQKWLVAEQARRTGFLILADKERMRILFRNLIENACKYSLTSAGGKKQVVVSYLNNQQSRIIHVRDFGQGIARDSLKNVFEPFYRTDLSRSRATGGYGLGLSLCRDIVRQHGGTIRIASQKGQGTVVKIVLPS